MALPALYPMTKFQIPPGREEHVLRLRCLNAVDDVPFVPHVLIGAPAGSGKSTLAAQLAARVRGRTAWISVEPSDDEPGQFWAAIVSGIAHACGGLGAELVPGLIGGGDIDSVLVSLVNALAGLDEELLLVIDDLHEISSAAAIEGVAWLLEYAPSQVRIVLCSRVDPDIGIARLNARGLLRRLHVAELRFDAAESASFLNRGLGLALDEPDVREVAKRTDGWAAGIYLAGLSLRSGVTPQQLLARLDAGDRLTRDYMAEEVLRSLTPEIAAFLNEICHLDRFCGDLCDEVAQRIDSTELLRELDRANMFVIRLDTTGTWRRLHHLFAGVLRERVAATDQDGLRDRHQRAAVWFEHHDEPAEAIRHFIAAGDHADACRLIGAWYPLYLNTSRHGVTVARWLEQLPLEIIERDPTLCVAGAWLAIVNADPVTCDARLELAAAADPHRPLPDGTTVAAQTALIRGAVPRGALGETVRSAREAIALVPPGSHWEALALGGAAAWGVLVDGPTDAVLEHASRATAFDPRSSEPIAVLDGWSSLAAIRAERGEHHLAGHAVTMSITAAEELGLDRVPVSAHVWSLAGYAELLGRRIERGVRLAEVAFRLVGDAPVERDPWLFGIFTRIVLAMARDAQGKGAEARVLVGEARERMQHVTDPGRLPEMVSGLERQLGMTGQRSVDTAGELSERELELLRALAAPTSLREVAGELFISYNTAKTHARSIYAKLGVASREAAIERARQLHLIS